MADATLSGSVIKSSWGSLELRVATFSNIDDTNTYDSGIKRVVGYWCNGTDDPTTQASGAIDVSESSGTFTFNTGEDGRTGMLYVLSERTI